MKIKVFQVLDHDTQERLDCGYIELATSTENPCIKSVDEAEVSVAGGSKIYLSCTFDSSTNNFSVFVREGELHMFTGMLHWGEVNPYFAFRLTDVTFTELFFEK